MKYIKGVVSRFASTVGEFFFVIALFTGFTLSGILEIPCYILFNFSPMSKFDDLVEPYIDYE